MNPNVYIRSRSIVQELSPIVQQIRRHDKSLADQLRRAAQSVVLNIAEARGNDAVYCGFARGERIAVMVRPSIRAGVSTWPMSSTASINRSI